MSTEAPEGKTVQYDLDDPKDLERLINNVRLQIDSDTGWKNQDDCEHLQNYLETLKDRRQKILNEQGGG